MSTRNVSYTQFIMYTHNTSIVYVYARCKGQPCNDITENNLKLNISVCPSLYPSVCSSEHHLSGAHIFSYNQIYSIPIHQNDIG